MIPSTQLLSTWPPQFTMDLALGVEDLGSILDRYGLVKAQFDHLYALPAFRMELAALRKEVAEKGITFRRKAALQAEMYLAELDNLMADVSGSVAPGVKVDIFKTLAKLGDLEPKESKTDQGGSTSNIQININI
jgi:hypothetical protein